MTDPKFTPGPWLLMANQIGTQETEIASICLTAQIRLPKDETKANAHLIAAAPELYEALDALRAELFLYAEGNYFRPLLDKAEIALAKARGESNA